MIRPPASDSEIKVVLGMMAEESSKSAQLESGCGAPEQSSAGGKRADNLVSARHKRSCQLDAHAKSLSIEGPQNKLTVLILLSSILQN
jgi:hypothetical protein